jgi:hypothetical protein
MIVLRNRLTPESCIRYNRGEKGWGIVARRCVILSLCLLLFSTGCRPEPGAHEADIKVLREVELAEKQAWISRDLQKAIGLMPTMLSRWAPNAPAVTGKDQIRASVKPLF